MRRTPPRVARGFTVLEIMIALVIIVMGLVALFQLELVSIQGNTAAGKMTQATGLAERWIEKLRRDAILWNDPLRPPPASLTPTGAWRAAAAVGVMINKDMQAPELGEDVLNPTFCMVYRITEAPPASLDQSIVRADVRVVWPRAEAAINDLIACTLPDIIEPGNLNDTWQVSLSTLIFRHREET